MGGVGVLCCHVSSWFTTGGSGKHEYFIQFLGFYLAIQMYHDFAGKNQHIQLFGGRSFRHLRDWNNFVYHLSGKGTNIS